MSSGNLQCWRGCRSREAEILSYDTSWFDLFLVLFYSRDHLHVPACAPVWSQH